MGLKLNEVIAKIDDFSEQRDWGQFHTLKNLASSICIEASELLECFQWIDPSTQDIYNNPNLESQIQQEIADVLIYALRLCSILNYDPIELITTKLNLNDEKYPVQLSKGSSAKYDQIK
jgi:dCTP diphosphatase